MIVTYGHVSRDPYGMLCILADNLALLLKSIIYFMNTWQFPDHLALFSEIPTCIVSHHGELFNTRIVFLI